MLSVILPTTLVRKLDLHPHAQRIDRELPLEPVGRVRPSDVASRYRYKDGGGEIGVTPA